MKVTLKMLEEDGNLILDYPGHREYIYNKNRFFVNYDDEEKKWFIDGAVFEPGHKCEFIGCRAKATYIQENKRCCFSHLGKIHDRWGKEIRPVIEIGGN